MSVFSKTKALQSVAIHPSTASPGMGRSNTPAAPIERPDSLNATSPAAQHKNSKCGFTDVLSNDRIALGARASARTENRENTFSARIWKCQIPRIVADL